MVNKTSTQAPKTTAKKPVKKVASSAAKAKKSVEKKVEEKVLNRQVPVKENVNPVKEVLEIKAHNEERKAFKKAKKSPVKAKSVSAATKKTVTDKPVDKQKVLSKSEVMALEEKSLKRPTGMWAIWWDTIKKTFDYKGRTSRYEYWAFMLINLPVFCLLMLFLPILSFLVTKLEIAGLAAAIAIFAIELLIMSSLTVRRIHDTGSSAWKGYFKPLVLTSLVWIILLVTLNLLIPLMTNLTTLNVVSGVSILLFFVFLFIWIFYFTKIGVVSSYYESDGKDNKYGKLAFYEGSYKAKGLRYTVLFLTICSYIYALIYAFVHIAHSRIM